MPARMLEYVDTRGNQWQTLVEQYEFGYWIREGSRPPFTYGGWTHYPVPDANRFDTFAEAWTAAHRIRAQRTERPEHATEAAEIAERFGSTAGALSGTPNDQTGETR